MSSTSVQAVLAHGEPCCEYLAAALRPWMRSAWGAWIFHLYPAVYLMIAQYKQCSELALYYCVLALVLTCVTTNAAMMDGGKLRVLHKVLTILSSVVFGISAVFHICYAAGWRVVAVGDVVGLLHPSLRGFSGVGGNSASWLFLDFFIMVAAVFTWLSVDTDLVTVAPSLFSRLAAMILPETPIDEPESRPRLSVHRRVAFKGVPLCTPPLTEMTRMVQLSLWLLLIAVLDFSAFAAVYYLMSTFAMLLITLWLPNRDVIKGLRIGLIGFAFLHLSIDCGYLSIMCRFSSLPNYYTVLLLGQPGGGWHALQCCCVLVLIVELLRAVPEDMQLDSMASEPLSQSGEMSPQSRAVSDFISLRTEQSSTPWLDKVMSRTIPWLLLTNAEESMPASAVKQRIRDLLPLVSLCLWPLVWPVAPSVPLLIFGLIALERHLNELPWCGPELLQAITAYQGILCTFCYISSVKSKANTSSLDLWEQSMGLETFVFDYLSSVDFRRTIVLTVLSALTLGVALGAVPHDEHSEVSAARATRANRPTISGTTLGHWRARALFGIRILIVSVVLALALTGGPSGESSITQLGYLAWFIYLMYRSDDMPVNVVGWDILHGDQKLWIGLQVYSGFVATAVLFWRALIPFDFSLFGFHRSSDDYRLLTQIWIHLGISALASTQVHVMPLESSYRASIFLVIQPFVRSLLNFGLILQFSLLLIAGLWPPVSIEAFILLTLFSIVVVVSQFTTKRSYFVPILNVTVVVGMLLLIMRCLVSVSVVQQLLHHLIPEKQHPGFWHTFQIQSRSFDPVRQFLIALLVLLSRVLVSSFKLEMLRMDDSVYKKPPDPRLARILGILQRWCPCVVILAAYITVISRPSNVLSSLQLVVLECSLIVGRGWDKVGAFLSICSVSMLLSQYICRHDFISVSEEHKLYWGLQWSPVPLVMLLGLAVIQRTVHYHATSAAEAVHDLHSTFNMDSSQDSSQDSDGSKLAAEHPDTLKADAVFQSRLNLAALKTWAFISDYGAHLGCVVVLSAAVLRNSVWSLMHALTVGAFLVSGDAPRMLTASQTRSWLQTMALMLMFAPLSATLLDLWLPPGTYPRPDTRSVGEAAVCQHFEGHISRKNNGALCFHREESCRSQSDRCALDWMSWLLIGRGTIPEFVAFFFICLLKRADQLLLGHHMEDHELCGAESYAEDLDVRRGSESCHSVQSFQSNEPSACASTGPDWDEGELFRDEQDKHKDGPDGVELSMKLHHIDFSALSANQNLLSVLKLQAKAAISDSIGSEAKPGNVHVVLQPDSSRKPGLVLRAVVDPPSMLSHDAVINRLHREATALSEVLAASFGSLLSGTLAASGTISVSDVIVEKPGLRYIFAATICVWVMLFVCFLSQATTDVIAMGYLGLLLHHVIKAGNANMAKDPVAAFVQPVLHISIFNFLVIFCSLAFQCPSMPCPHTMTLEMTDGRVPDYSSFCSAQQCHDLSQKQGHDNDHHDHTVMLGVLFRCLGLVKIYAVRKSPQRLASMLLFIALLVLKSALWRWRKHLRRYMEGEQNRLQKRADWYITKLLARRHLQLSDWDTKREILLGKLGRLAQHLDDVRDIWDGLRPAFTETEERLREWETRLENMCLITGQDTDMVEMLLVEFDEAAGVVDNRDPRIISDVNNLVQDYLHHKQLCTLRKITEAEQNDAYTEGLDKASKLRNKMPELSKTFSHVSSVASSQSAASTTPSSALRRRSLIAMKRASTLAMPLAEGDEEQAAEEIKKKTSLPSADETGILHHCLNTLIDDTIFFQEGHITLRQHRKNNGLPKLAVKALCSQTMLLLLLACALQFVVSQSVLAAISVFVVTMSLIAFPHVPFRFWTVMQAYVIVVILAKMTIQLPIFCSDGSLRIVGYGLFDKLGPCSCGDGSSAPFNAVLGLAKVRAPDVVEKCNGQSPNYLEFLGCDILVCLVLVLSMLVARYSGRFNDLRSILHLFEQQDALKQRYNEVAAVNSESPVADIPSVTVHGPRKSLARCFVELDQPSACLEEKELANDRRIVHFSDSDKDEIAHNESDKSLTRRLNSGKRKLADELKCIASSLGLPEEWGEVAEDEIGDDKNEAHLRKAVKSLMRSAHQKCRAKAKRWLQELIGSSRARRPSLDLYLYRLFCHLVCMVILFVGWSKMTNSTRSFSESFSDSNFTGSQAIVLIVYLLLIVTDRALYTWYVVDEWEAKEEGDEEEETSDGEKGDEMEAMLSPTSAESPSLAFSPSRSLGFVNAKSVCTAASRTRRDSVFVPTQLRDTASVDVEGKTSEEIAEEATSVWNQLTSSGQGRRAVATKIQAILVVLQLLFVHGLLIRQWRQGLHSGSNSLFSYDKMSTLLFYSCYITYLGLTALQLRYDVHVIRGGVRFTHSTDLIPLNCFRVYNLIPFLHELRVLTDWTATKTSLNFYMWMKLEDIHHNLYRTKCDFEWRNSTEYAEPRSVFEKCYLGVLLLVLILFLLVGPVMFCSNLNMFFVEENAVERARLEMFIEVPQSSGPRKSLNIFSSSQISLQKLSDSPDSKGDEWLRQNFEQQEKGRVSVQELSFPTEPEDGWSVAPGTKLHHMTKLLEKVDSEVYMVLNLEFDRVVTGKASSKHEETVKLKDEQKKRVIAAFKVVHCRRLQDELCKKGTHDCQWNEANSRCEAASAPVSPAAASTPVLPAATPESEENEKISFVIPGIFHPYLQLGAGPAAKTMSTKKERGQEKDMTNRAADALSAFDVTMTLTDIEGTVGWTMEVEPSQKQPRVCSVDADFFRRGPKEEKNKAEEKRCKPVYFLVNEWVSAYLAGGNPDEKGKGGSGSVSIITMYATVVFTIGNLLRQFFKGASHRIIYEELPDTELLLDLCNGVYIARIQGNLKAEYKLYHEMLRIFRSPELLAHVTRERRRLEWSKEVKRDEGRITLTMGNTKSHSDDRAKWQAMRANFKEKLALAQDRTAPSHGVCIACPRCGVVAHNENAKYCHNCGQAVQEFQAALSVGAAAAAGGSSAPAMLRTSVLTSESSKGRS